MQTPEGFPESNWIDLPIEAGRIDNVWRSLEGALYVDTLRVRYRLDYTEGDWSCYQFQGNRLWFKIVTDPERLRITVIEYL